MTRVFTVPYTSVRAKDPAWVSRAKSDGQEIANVADYHNIKPKTHDYQPNYNEMKEIAQLCGT